MMQRNEIKSKIMESGVKVLYHFILAQDKKLVGFEKHLLYADKIYIVHKKAMTVFFNIPHKWGCPAGDDLSIVDSYSRSKMSYQAPIPDIDHNRKTLITIKNIDLICDSLYKNMQKWRWDLIDTYWQAGQGRKIHIAGADAVDVYNDGEYPSVFNADDIKNNWNKITKEEYGESD